MKCRCEEYRNMLEDVINELNLSDEVIEKHGPLGTPPAEIVRLVLEGKDRTIAALKNGFKIIHTKNMPNTLKEKRKSANGRW